MVLPAYACTPGSASCDSLRLLLTDVYGTVTRRAPSVHLHRNDGLPPANTGVELEGHDAVVAPVAGISHLFSGVRRRRRQHEDQASIATNNADRRLALDLPRVLDVSSAWSRTPITAAEQIELVHLHHRGDRRVQLLALLDVGGHTRTCVPSGAHLLVRIQRLARVRAVDTFAAIVSFQ
jgi:hypothetical protein